MKGKVAVVTGSTAGIGRSIALYFASAGAHVAVTGRNKDTAEKLAHEIQNQGGAATPFRFDLSDPSGGEALLDKVIKSCGRLDILVNNAICGGSDYLPRIHLQDMNYDQIQKGITANITNTLVLIGKAYPYLKQAKGNMLNIGSVVVNRKMLGIPLLYTIIKGAVTQVTLLLAAEWAGDGIRVNQINPGCVQSDAFKKPGISEDHRKSVYDHYQKFHPLGRVGIPDDIGALAAFMVSDEAAWMTGSVVDMDGGYTIQGVSPV